MVLVVREVCQLIILVTLRYGRAVPAGLHPDHLALWQSCTSWVTPWSPGTMAELYQLGYTQVTQHYGRAVPVGLHPGHLALWQSCTSWVIPCSPGTLAELYQLGYTLVTQCYGRVVPVML